jgi:hypothetical protein
VLSFWMPVAVFFVWIVTMSLMVVRTADSRMSVSQSGPQPAMT